MSEEKKVDEAKELTLSSEELATLINEAVEKQLVPLKEDVGMVRKTILPEAKDLGKLEGVEKAARWLQALAAGDIATVKALSEGTPADGGYLVPTEFRAIVVEKLYKASAIRPFATIIPMNRDVLEVPVEGTAVTAYWKAENSELDESNPDFGQVKLNTNKLTGLSKMSRELLADSAINVVNYVAAGFARAFQKQEDTAFMTGSGTGEPKGLRQYTIPSEPQAAAALTGNDLIALYYKLPSQYRRNAVWLINNAVIKLVRQLIDDNKRYLWTDGLGEAPATILGRPVVEQNDIPIDLGTGADESEIWFGDLSFYLIGDRESMTVEQSTQAGDAFAYHQLWLKVIERVDGQLAQTEAFVKLTGVK